MIKVALTGLRFSGKTTLFKAILGKEPTKPSRPDEPWIGNTHLPDKRVKYIGDYLKVNKYIYPTIELSDIPGDSDRDKIIHNTRFAEGLIHVIQAFDETARVTDPVQALKEWDAELLLCDQIVVENRLQRVIEERKKRKSEQLDRELVVLEKCVECLGHGDKAASLDLNDEDAKIVKGFGLFTTKPQLIVINSSEDDIEAIATINAVQPHVDTRPIIALPAQLAYEIEQLNPADQQAFMQDLGFTQKPLDLFSTAIMEALHLGLFITFNDQESHGWEFKLGLTAQQCAGIIHSDIEKGFIKGEIITYEDVVKYECSYSKTKDAGKMRTEGKNYIMQDGDVVHFRFNI
jgi:ribosome-binding ATPase